MTDLLLLPGDGIGPEIAEAAVKIAAATMPNLALETGLVGGASIDATGDPITHETLDKATKAKAVLLGAVGGPKWADVARDKRPEMGLLRLRKHLDVFANLRPALCFPALSGASSLKPALIDGLDILIVRELTSGVYFGTPRGEMMRDGEPAGYETSIYKQSEVERIAKTAFDFARKRGGRVCSVDKANVMESGVFWRRIVTQTHAEFGEGVALSHMYADACAMELVRAPKQFDVILSGNLFGDVLSDIAAMLTGSIGMLPSAALGAEGAPGLFEPVHGSAPDIAGQGIANPCAMILSLAMAARASLGRADVATAIENAVSHALEAGHRTADIGGQHSTTEMTNAILDALA